MALGAAAGGERGGCVAELAERTAADGVGIDGRANWPGWDGRVPDYVACIEAVLPRQ